MKKLLLIITIVLSGALFAQEETLIDTEIDHGGFGGPSVKFSSLQDNLAVMVGGYGGWIIDHTFVIGGAGYGLANRIRVSDVAQQTYGTGQRLNTEFGYGGLYLEYINKSDDLIHLTISTIIGGGAVVYNERGDDWDHEWDEDSDKPHDVFFVLEPNVNVELNIAKFFRVNFGAGYRFVSGVNLVGIKNSDLSSPSLSLNFKFGSF